MKTKVLIAFPVGGSCHPAFVKALLDLQLFELTDPSSIYEILPIEYSASLYVEENRNVIVDLAHQQKADWILMLDTDESFQPQLLRQLMTHADKDANPIVFGIYSNISRAPVETKGGYYHVDMIYREMPSGEYSSITPPSDSRPFYVDAAGSGCMLTHISVFDKIEFPWFTLDYILLEGKPRPQLMNEDISFCRKARMAGYKLLVDPLAEIVHYKTLALLPSAFRHFMERANKVHEEMKRLA
jgi:GT2 family glycosyltransferase